MKKRIIFRIILMLLILGCQNAKQNCHFEISEVNKRGFNSLNKFLKNPYNTKELDSSIYQFDKVLSCDTLNHYAIKFITLSYLYKNEYNKALEINNKAIKNISSNSSFLKARGEIYELMNDIDSAKFYFNKALKLNLYKEKKDKKNIDIKIEILFLLGKLENKKLREEKLKEYLEEYPDNETLKKMSEIIEE